ncbi:MAG: SDR family NAD(P)-dependent oxidoreductase [Pseudomonadota bacterium]
MESELKSILITGCSSGIGYDAAITLKEHGWRVFATCRKQADCDRLTAEGLESFALDHTDHASMENALKECLARTGGTLDALFNNGAYGIPGPVEDIPTAALREIFEANVFGYHALTKMVIPVMRAQGHGRIINCSSVLGFAVMRWRGAYNATKFALEGLTDTLRLEMRDTAIKVVLIQPGPIKTKIRENSIPHFEKWVKWENSARRAQYESHLLKDLYEGSGNNIFELPASAVTATLIKALEHPNPKPRYRVTRITTIMAILKRILPTRTLDWLSAKL